MSLRWKSLKSRAKMDYRELGKRLENNEHLNFEGNVPVRKTVQGTRRREDLLPHSAGTMLRGGGDVFWEWNDGAREQKGLREYVEARCDE